MALGVPTLINLMYLVDDKSINALITEDTNEMEILTKPWIYFGKESTSQCKSIEVNKYNHYN